MPEELELLCSWELQMPCEETEDIMRGIANSLKRSGFEKKDTGEWTNGTLTLRGEYSEGDHYNGLKIYLNAPRFMFASFIDHFDQCIRKYGDYIKSLTFVQNDAYIERAMERKSIETADRIRIKPS